ncbi:MAG: hypothetical protein LBC39_07720 [Methanobrevibacter sp.]|jgi:hypothetical protein|nr:hypothetical protein [Candidatus Methanovirga aequatorialis]
MNEWNDRRLICIILISLLVIGGLFYYGSLLAPKTIEVPVSSSSDSQITNNNDLKITNITVSGVKSVSSTGKDYSNNNKSYKYNYLTGNLILKFNKEPSNNKDVKYIVDYYMDNDLIKSEIKSLSYISSSNVIGNEYHTTISYNGETNVEVNKVIVYNSDRSISSEHTFDTIKFYSTEGD